MCLPAARAVPSARAACLQVSCVTLGGTMLLVPAVLAYLELPRVAGLYNEGQRAAMLAAARSAPGSRSAIWRIDGSARRAERGHRLRLGDKANLER
jgi:hypothetical protein